jgi:predicted phosphate transport protein (TIGR00153 family)
VKDIFSRIKDMLITQEITLFQELRRHTYLSLKAVELLIEAYEGNADRRNHLYRKIEKLEKEGDRLSNEITRLILDGAIIVSLQNYLITLMDILDNILDTIHFLGGETYRREYFEKIRTKEVRAIEKKILNYLKHSMKSIEELIKLLDKVISGEWEDIIDITTRIEEIEEEGDDMKHLLIDEIYSKWEQVREPYFSYLVHFIYMIDELEDLCEDASNIILITLQHIRT